MLVVDDVRAGLRIARDCSWSVVGVKPDLSTWGKAIANGHPISALLGADTAREGAQSIYVTGSFWYAMAPMAAALETLRLVRETNYLEKTERLGQQLRDGLHDSAGAHGFSLRQTGPAQMPLIMFDEDPDLRLGFAWASEMLKRGIYMHPWHNMFLCDAMDEDDISAAINAADGAFAALKRQRPTLGPVTKLAAFA